MDKKLIFNPVPSPPWNIDVRKKNHENPARLSVDVKNKSQQKEINFSLHKRLIPSARKYSLSQKEKNVKHLTSRFHNLRKNEAKAALTMARNNLEKAIVLLEVSQCYRQEIISRPDSDLTYLKNIQIKLRYEHVPQNPLIRNIVIENSFGVGNELHMEGHGNSGSLSGYGTFDESCSSDSSKSRRVGIIIEKTLGGGYKATPFDFVFDK